MQKVYLLFTGRNFMKKYSSFFKADFYLQDNMEFSASIWQFHMRRPK